MKASEITADAILYWDPATSWLNAPSHRAAQVKVLDPVVRHWGRQGDNFEARPRRSASTSSGILVEVWAGDPYYPGMKRVASLNSLHGPYEQAVALVEANRQKRLDRHRVQREQEREQMWRQEKAIADAAAIGIKATGLYPGTTVQVPIEQFETMVAVLRDNSGWCHVAD